MPSPILHSSFLQVSWYDNDDTLLKYKTGTTLRLGLHLINFRWISYEVRVNQLIQSSWLTSEYFLQSVYCRPLLLSFYKEIMMDRNPYLITTGISFHPVKSVWTPWLFLPFDWMRKDKVSISQLEICIQWRFWEIHVQRSHHWGRRSRNNLKYLVHAFLWQRSFSEIVWLCRISKIQPTFYT